MILRLRTGAYAIDEEGQLWGRLVGSSIWIRRRESGELTGLERIELAEARERRDCGPIRVTILKTTITQIPH